MIEAMALLDTAGLNVVDQWQINGLSSMTLLRLKGRRRQDPWDDRHIFTLTQRTAYQGRVHKKKKSLLFEKKVLKLADPLLPGLRR